ncbi:hypothetical protein PAXRUDRAFT_408179 [Paxillus rubicundulus Ve08.2h10]|uniref:F-box domain-containing protein n=1 Tax=Paxillus rubicundulus Ve08.2h10 TaxID=930991 RepID=A0A0D0E2W6_9AGAM|nr:hypothetical protein PAXRUDRAFT_408179 [Paxillus rubicundulus Ve08.2h10]
MANTQSAMTYPAAALLFSLISTEPLAGSCPARSDRPFDGQPTSAISVLPNELLIEIFEYVYLACHEESCRSHGTDGADDSLSQPSYETRYNPHSSSLFPYNIATVCRAWKDMVCSGSFPAFWTRVVIVTGITTPETVRELLSLSRGLPVGVSVISGWSSQVERRKGPEPGCLGDETASADCITRLVLPNVKRLKKLQYFLSRSSSLAAVRRALRGKSRLEELWMECEEDDGEGEKTVGGSGEDPGAKQLNDEENCGWKFITFAVKHLHVDNYTFKLACSPKSDGFHDLTRVGSITLSWPRLVVDSGCGNGGGAAGIDNHGYLRRSAGRIDFREFLAVLQEAPDLRCLTVRNEQFEGLDDDCALVCDLPSLRFVTLDGIRARFIRRFCHSINANVDSISAVRVSGGVIVREELGVECRVLNIDD